ncbi:MAG: hypothetical protein AAF602_18595 [Myxococcota bacterium]
MDTPRKDQVGSDEGDFRVYQFTMHLDRGSYAIALVIVTGDGVPPDVYLPDPDGNRSDELLEPNQEYWRVLERSTETLQRPLRGYEIKCRVVGAIEDFVNEDGVFSPLPTKLTDIVAANVAPHWDIPDYPQTSTDIGDHELHRTSQLETPGEGRFVSDARYTTTAENVAQPFLATPPYFIPDNQFGIRFEFQEVSDERSVVRRVEWIHGVDDGVLFKMDHPGHMLLLGSTKPVGDRFLVNSVH